MKINHIMNNMPTVAPIKGTASGLTHATGSSLATTTVSGTTCRTGDSPSLSVQQVSRQVGSGDFGAAHVGQIHSVIQNSTLKMDAGKIADVVPSDTQPLLSTYSKKI